MRNLLVAICTCSLFLIVSCKHDPILPPEPDISFAKDVQPILVGNCTASGCHGDEFPEEFSVLTYDGVMEEVEAENLYDSEIYERITTSDLIKRMPQSLDKLTDAQIEIIEKWITQGAKNN